MEGRGSATLPTRTRGRARTDRSLPLLLQWPRCESWPGLLQLLGNLNPALLTHDRKNNVRNDCSSYSLHFHDVELFRRLDRLDEGKQAKDCR